MTNDQKKNAVLVAQDVLVQLRRKSVPLTMSDGDYLVLHDASRINHMTDDLQGCVDEVQQYCRVCARGALVLSKARLLNKVPMWFLRIDDGLFLDQHETTELLEDVWDREQLDLIEAAYEQTDGLETSSVPEELVYGAVVFGMKYPGKKKRLAAIMKNIVEHEGVFDVKSATWDEMAKVKPSIDSQNFN